MVRSASILKREPFHVLPNKVLNRLIVHILYNTLKRKQARTFNIPGVVLNILKNG